MNEREHVIREVIKVLPEVAHVLRRAAAGDAAAMHLAAGPPGAAAPEVSAAQLRALVHLAQYGPQTMGELAEGMQITMASATGLVKPLVEIGYVTRTRDPQDQRVVRVVLSEPAQEMARRILAERRHDIEEALSGMSDEACRHFLEGLERLARRWR